MKSIYFILLCIASAIAYGIVHDQFTARICVEYFTIGHPHLIDSQSPTLLGIAWGIVATWWVGLGLGIPLAIAARAGSRRKRDARSLMRPIGYLLGTMAVCAAVAGLIGGYLARTGAVVLQGPLAERVPADRHIAFMIDAWAHSASYLVGFVGGIVVIAGTAVSRFRRETEASVTRE